MALKDLDFEINEDQAKALGIAFPFRNVNQAELALRERVITPTIFLEDDDTRHLVEVFDPMPISFHRYKNWITYSLALTDQGLFDVGRYPVMNVAGNDCYWQWFLHRRLATTEQVAAWKELYHLSAECP